MNSGLESGVRMSVFVLKTPGLGIYRENVKVFQDKLGSFTKTFCASYTPTFSRNLLRRTSCWEGRIDCYILVCMFKWIKKEEKMAKNERDIPENNEKKKK